MKHIFEAEGIASTDEGTPCLAVTWEEFERVTGHPPMENPPGVEPAAWTTESRQHPGLWVLDVALFASEQRGQPLRLQPEAEG